MSNPEIKPEPISMWHKPAVIAENNFQYKSLSDWAYNVAVGCEHACRFCYVPAVSTNRMGAKLKEYGVDDPASQWGDYVMLRQWDQNAFRQSMIRANNKPLNELSKDGNRAVMFCTTTDGWQVIRHPDVDRRRELQDQLKTLVRSALTHILKDTTLNVRILTRSPLAKRDFDLMAEFGPRLTFGMSLPTLNDKLAKVYEPKAPSPTARLATLHAAKEAGLHVFVAVAPTYPECGPDDLRATLTAIKELNPITVYHEPINIRAENVALIKANGVAEGLTMESEVFESAMAWRHYAVTQLLEVEIICGQLGIADRLHLWPDKSLGSTAALKHMGQSGSEQERYLAWLWKYWNRVSEWPK